MTEKTYPFEVNVDTIKAGKAADEDLWQEYITQVNPNDSQYMPYQRWLAYMIVEMRKKK